VGPPVSRARLEENDAAPHLVATAPQNDFYNLKGRLDNNKLILQSGRTPGVWLVQADGANLHRVAVGTFLGVMMPPP
jgi:hypothetical protein